MQFRVINKNNTEINEYHRMRFSLWPHHNEKELYNEMLQILEGKTFYKNELSWTVFVAVRDDGSLGGFIEVTIYPELVYCDSQPIGYIEGWYVDEDSRNKGVGKSLVDIAQKWVMENECTEIASDVEIDNSVSQLAHQALGFTEYDLTNECIFYKKSLI
ncbi:MAG TPA: GNAT family N-acetyltransferase [Lachnospiraceae bacterium]|nr:GNAT family N-acetyltransferase [Lachnospiraceae bacterium]